MQHEALGSACPFHFGALDRNCPSPYNGKFTVTQFFDLMNFFSSPAGSRWAALFYARSRSSRFVSLTGAESCFVTTPCTDARME
jgi:hypothetical protein